MAINYPSLYLLSPFWFRHFIFGPGKSCFVLYPPTKNVPTIDECVHWGKCMVFYFLLEICAYFKSEMKYTLLLDIIFQQQFINRSDLDVHHNCCFIATFVAKVCVLSLLFWHKNEEVFSSTDIITMWFLLHCIHPLPQFSKLARLVKLLSFCFYFGILNYNMDL